MFGSKNGVGSSTKNGLMEHAELPDLQLDDAVFDAGVALAEPAKVVLPKKGASMPGRTVEPDCSAHLYIGANIRLKGEIAGCDLMRIEGTYEGTTEASHLIVCPGGTFIGIANVEDAEIEGAFHGTLNVRGRLFLRANGRVRGNLSYGQIEIERGGEIEGHINPARKAEKAETKPAVVAEKPALVVEKPVIEAKPAPEPKPIPAPAANLMAKAAMAQARMVQPAAARPAMNGVPVNGAHAVNGAVPPAA